MDRLIRLEALSQAQQRTLKQMLDSEGLCSCGREMSPISAKFIFCNATSQHPMRKDLHGALIMGAYCYSCAAEINGLLKKLKERGNGWIAHRK